MTLKIHQCQTLVLHQAQQCRVHKEFPLLTIDYQLRILQYRSLRKKQVNQPTLVRIHKIHLMRTQQQNIMWHCIHHSRLSS